MKTFFAATLLVAGLALFVSAQDHHQHGTQKPSESAAAPDSAGGVIKRGAPLGDSPQVKFADALKESYQSIADRSVSAQELNAQVTQDFFNGVINNLRTQAEGNRALSEDLIEQQRRQREASKALAQESVNAYTDFLNSMFAYYKGNLDEAQRRANQ